MFFLLAVCNYQLQLPFNLNFACNRARVIRTLAHTHTHLGTHTQASTHDKRRMRERQAVW